MSCLFIMILAFFHIFLSFELIIKYWTIWNMFCYFIFTNFIFSIYFCMYVSKFNELTIRPRCKIQLSIIWNLGAKGQCLHLTNIIPSDWKHFMNYVIIRTLCFSINSDYVYLQKIYKQWTRWTVLFLWTVYAWHL